MNKEINQIVCTKYTSKRNDYCKTVCNSINKTIITNDIIDINYCPYCGNKLLEIGYGKLNVNN